MSPRRIKDLPPGERPREKLERLGAGSLSDAEILAIFFGTGRAGVSSVELGRELLHRYGTLRDLSRADIAELCQVKGIGRAKSAQLAAVFEFGRRIARQRYESRAITQPEDVYSLMGTEMQALAQESVRVVLLDRKKRLIRVEEVFLGTRDECFANPSELLRPAIVYGAVSMILVHNHPSGDPSPSAADIRATRRLGEATQTVGIDLDDHVILGSLSEFHPSGYFSFREGGLL